jgi:hypothetical protein
MAFQHLDFKKAEKIFNTLQSTGNKEVAQKAGYALACTKWALADTPEVEKEAFHHWKKKRDLAQKSTGCNGAKMLEVLLETITGRTYKKYGSQNATGEALCQTQLYLRDREIKRLNQRIRAMKGQVIVLKKKIKTIEEIDQKIQEKKADPPPP